ncbi:unnamed protein product, partial [Vitis vinifera]
MAHIFPILTHDLIVPTILSIFTKPRQTLGAYLMHLVYHNLQVHDFLTLYNEIDVPPKRLLFKIPSTWQGIEASRLLESEGIQTHLTFVYRLVFQDRLSILYPNLGL